MADQSKYQPSAFWFGFTMGTIATGLSVFFLGTKKGRTTLKKVMDMTENLEENAISLFQELEEKLEPVGSGKSSSSEKKAGTLDTIMHRIKNFAPENKQEKRFFTKE